MTNDNKTQQVITTMTRSAKKKPTTYLVPVKSIKKKNTRPTDSLVDDKHSFKPIILSLFSLFHFRRNHGPWSHPILFL